MDERVCYGLGMPGPDGSQPHRGRPRRAAIDAAILRAAVELMTELGVQGTTLSAVARRAAVARATVYLRWPTRSALIGAAARSAAGGRLLPLTGNLETDLPFAAVWVQRVFDDPALPAMLPEIIRGVLADPPELSFDSVAPRRREVARIYRERAAIEGFATEVDPHLPFDIMLGTAIAYLLANRRPMSDADAERLGLVVVEGLRAMARREATSEG
jgi:AcrR family transcriptional regulator